MRYYSITSILPAACLAFFCASVHAEPPVSIGLEKITPVSAIVGHGAVRTNLSTTGTALTIGGKDFATGLGVHAASELIYDLDGSAKKFEAWVGMDDALLIAKHPEAPKGSVVFQVFADSTKLFDSGVMHIGDAAKRVSVDLKGKNELRLVVTDAGDGIACDHANWAEPVLTTLPVEPALAKYHIKTDGLSVGFDAKGRLAGAEIGKNQWPVSGTTVITGFSPTGEVKAVKDSSGGYAFTRTLADAAGHTAQVIDRFTPDKGAVRWNVEITSHNPIWTAPIVSRMKCDQPEERLIWTAWGSPDYLGTQLTPELAALVQAGKTSVSGTWSDPLVPVGFLNRIWHYGNIAQSVPAGGDFIALPLLTVLAPKSDTGLSLVLSPDDVLLNMDLLVSENGQFQYSRKNHRLGGGKTVKFTMHIVPHEADWRGGLRFMTERHAEYFNPPNPRAHKIGGCGAYTLCEDKVDPVPLKKMAFGFNWKLSDDFPYMGMFIPPVKNMDEQWERSCSEAETLGQGRMTSCRQMNNYAKYMKDNGFSVLSYFNVTEFGKDMNRGGQRQPVRSADDPELWKDPAGYVKHMLPNAVWNPWIQTCYYAYITDPADSDYLKFMLEQAERNTTMLPDTDGICIDRADWLRLYNTKADDGVSWVEGRPARSLFRSWIALMDKMGTQMHKADKVIFSNMMTMRLELCKELDGIYTEFGQNGNALNTSALLCIRKPAIGWSYNETIHQPNPDAFMQRHLHMGIFPTAPYPRNNHCIRPEPTADRLYLDYGSLLTAMRGKKWVLVPHCVETATPDIKVNLFEVPGGYALPVTFGGTAETAIVRIRNIQGLEKLKAAALHPGADVAAPVASGLKDGVLTLTIPLKRGCAMVKLTAIQ